MLSLTGIISLPGTQPISELIWSFSVVVPSLLLTFGFLAGIVCTVIAAWNSVGREPKKFTK